jgi:uncharacterized protein
MNSEAIKDWAKQQGFATCLPDGDLHVTVAFDKKKHDWRDLPLDAPSSVDVLHPDERKVEEFRNNAIVLEIYSVELFARWAELIQSGLHWKWPDYRPHITITYNMPEHLDVSKVTPFDGVIELGPEVATEVIWDVRNKIDEQEL